MRISASNNSALLRIATPIKLRYVDARLITRVLQSSSVISAVIDDRNVQNQLGSVVVNDYLLQPVAYGGAYAPESVASYTSNNTNVATVNSQGYVSYVSNGDATITCTVARITKEVVLSFEETANATNSVFVDYVAPSLAKHITDNFDTRLVGKNKQTHAPIFTTQDHVNNVYVRNPNVWCSDFVNALTCISPYNSYGINYMGGTLISPRHIVFAAHWEIATNKTIRFVKADNTVVTRTIIAKATSPGIIDNYPDISIGLLDQDVDAGISFAKILPENWETYLPTANGASSGRIPVIKLDFEEKALIADLYTENTRTSLAQPTNGIRAEMYETTIGGDSGNPILTIINNTPVILSVMTYGGSGAGTSIRNQKSTINAMMTQLGGGYQLTEIDLSGFPTY